MKKIFSALVAALCVFAVLSLNANAHPSQDNNDHSHDHEKETDTHIYGHVIEKSTDEHLPYIAVILKGTTIGVTTETTGHYLMREVPAGTYIIEVSAIGYKTITREIKVRKGVTYEANFVLEEDLVQLDGVIVSATRSETTRRMSPTLVNVVGMDVYNKTNSTTVAQGLVFQPGVRVENNCQNCGFQQVKINGLDGQYTQILIDSRPIFSSMPESRTYSIHSKKTLTAEQTEIRATCLVQPFLVAFTSESNLNTKLSELTNRPQPLSHFCGRGFFIE